MLLCGGSDSSVAYFGMGSFGSVRYTSTGAALSHFQSGKIDQIIYIVLPSDVGGYPDVLDYFHEQL